MEDRRNLFPTAEQKLLAAQLLQTEGLVVEYRWQSMLEIKTNFGLWLHLHHGYGSSSGSVSLGSYCCGTTMTPYHFDEGSAALCHTCQRLESIERREQLSCYLTGLAAKLEEWLALYLPPLEASLICTELQAIVWLVHDQQLPVATERVENAKPRVAYDERVSYD